mgnify:CR=1 FL=1
MERLSESRMMLTSILPSDSSFVWNRMEGLEKFREAFEAYSDNYVIIGGTACDITMTGTTVRPRATHDIDMIVVVEKMTADYLNLNKLSGESL